MQQVQTYRQRSRAFLSKAFEELEAGDLEQASEKGWGAVAGIIKAIAEERGCPHRSHRALHGAVDDLAQETGDAELVYLFLVASGMHSNFYEDSYRPTFVAAGIRHVERFVDKVEPLLNGVS